MWGFYLGNTNGPIVPRSIDQLIVVTDEDEEEECDAKGRPVSHDGNRAMGHGVQHQSVVQLTHRQQKAMQNRLDTLRRIKHNKALPQTQLVHIFYPQTNQPSVQIEVYLF